MAIWLGTKSMCSPEMTALDIVNNGGLELVGNMLLNSGFSMVFDRAWKQELKGKRSMPRFSDSMLAMVYALCIANGSMIFDSANQFTDEAEFICHCLGLKKIDLPSAVTIRQRLDLLGAHHAQLIPELADASIRLLRAYDMLPTGLPDGRIPLDFDVTPIDNSKTKKQGVSRTYKGFDGFAPMMVYIGLEGYLIEAELREGKHHSQKDTPQLLDRVLQRALCLTTNRLLVRMDSGNDAVDNLKVMLSRIAMGQDIDFIIKRNLRKETAESWFSTAIKDPNVKIENPRDGKRVFTGSVMWPIKYTRVDPDSMLPFDDTTSVRVVYRVTERTIIAKTQQICMIPQLEVETYWCNTQDSNEDIIELYHKHGTMEQFHSELKTDMDVERLPSAKFDTNAIVLGISMFVYNIERMLGQECCAVPGTPVKQKSFRRRLRSVLLNIILIPVLIVHHARNLQLKISASCAWASVYLHLWNRFAKADRFTRPSVV